MSDQGLGDNESKTHVGPQLRTRRFVPFLIALVLLLVGVLVFRNFLLGDKVLLYKDIGADSVNDTYPCFVHLSDYIRHHGLPSWSFCAGMGQSLFYLTGNLIWEPIIWLPRELITRALVFQHLIKTLIAGLLFFRFLQLRGLNSCASLLGSLLLVFSSYMCMGSCWIINADEIVAFTFLLFSAEVAISTGRWLYIPIAIALIGLVTVFHLYLAALLLCFYVPARLVEQYDWRPLSVLPIGARIGAAALLGVGLAAVVCLGSLHSILNTPRGSGLITNFTFGSAPAKVFHLESPVYYATAALRPFSNDIIGTGDKFRGWENYFEAPLTYCGLLPLLLFPQIFVSTMRRQRIIYALFLGLIIIPVVFPWMRWLFWLFRGGYFRAFSLFSIFGIIALSMTAFARYTERRALNFWILGGTLFVLLGFLSLPISGLQMLIDPGLRRVAAIFLILYATVLVTGQILKRQGIAGIILVIAAVIEVVYFDHVTVNRSTVTKQELKERVGYNDETVDAVREAKAQDNGFFRINKTWGSGLANRISYNDAMVFRFYGTPSYSSFNNLDYIKFLIAVDAIPSDNVATDAQWSPGLLWEPLLSTFACEKYVVTTDLVQFDTADHYEFVKRYGSIYLFRNKAFLPFGITFVRYFPEDQFLQMPKWAKSQALLHAAVLSDKDVPGKAGLSPITLDELKQRMRETLVPDALAERRASAFNMRSFEETRIEGTIRLERQGILLFQMPFDAGWHALADGRTAPVIRVDAGLLGVLLGSGEHSVRLSYRPPLLYTGASFTLVSLSLFLLCIWRWPRIRLPL
jgi:hypothetical protein